MAMPVTENIDQRCSFYVLLILCVSRFNKSKFVKYASLARLFLYRVPFLTYLSLIVEFTLPPL